MAERGEDLDALLDAAAEKVIGLPLLKLAGLLKDRKGDWAVRSAALQQIGVMVSENGMDAHDAAFKPVLEGIVAQLPDLRSQVVLAACSALTDFAAAVGDQQAMERPMRESVLPTLLTLTGNGNKVLAGAGRDCLPTVLEVCHFDSMLKARATPRACRDESLPAVLSAGSRGPRRRSRSCAS